MSLTIFKFLQILSTFRSRSTHIAVCVSGYLSHKLRSDTRVRNAEKVARHREQTRAEIAAGVYAYRHREQQQQASYKGEGGERRRE